MSKFNIEIEARSVDEAECLARGLDDPQIRAFVVVHAALKPLSNRARQRVCAYVADVLAEKAEGKKDV